MKLLLIKHSNSAHNAHQPPHEWLLTEEGILRCKPLAQHIAPYNPKRLFASTMPKASNTAELVAAELDGIPVILEPQLQEHSRKSNAPYGTVSDFQSRMKQLFAQPDELIFGDETANQALGRFTSGVNHIIKQAQPDENIVIIAHGTVNTMFTAAHNTIDSFELWSQLALPSIIVLDLPTFKLRTLVEDAGIPPA